MSDNAAGYSESSVPAMPLQYSSADDFRLVRPLLWLIAAMTAATVITEFSRLSFWLFRLVSSGRQSPWVGSELSFLAFLIFKIGLMVWVTWAALAALRSRRLANVQWACGVWAVVSVMVGSVLTMGYWFVVRQQGSAFMSTEWLVTSLLGILGTAVAPAAACIGLGHVRRRWMP